MSRIILFTRLDWIKLIALCVKGITGVIGGSMIINQEHPYTTIAVLSAGVVANEFVQVIKDKEVKKQSKISQDNEGA